MKIPFLKLVVFCAIMHNGNFFAQSNCRVHYEKIYDLQTESHHIFYDSTLSLSRQIKFSKHRGKEALEYGYAICQLQNCIEYSIIIDRMIELELQFNQPDRAEKLALERLIVKYPGWMKPEITATMEPEDLSILHSIHSSRNTKGFYHEVRKYKGLPVGCGSQTEGAWEKLNTSRFLQEQYGNIFSYRFLQNSWLPLNDDERTDSLWAKIYDEIINIWLDREDIDSILLDYHRSSFLEITPSFESQVYGLNHYIQVLDTRFYIYPKYQVINKRTHSVYPENLEEIKANSLLLKRLLYRKSILVK